MFILTVVLFFSFVFSVTFEKLPSNGVTFSSNEISLGSLDVTVYELTQETLTSLNEGNEESISRTAAIGVGDFDQNGFADVGFSVRNLQSGRSYLLISLGQVLRPKNGAYDIYENSEVKFYVNLTSDQREESIVKSAGDLNGDTFSDVAFSGYYKSQYFVYLILGRAVGSEGLVLNESSENVTKVFCSSEETKKLLDFNDLGDLDGDGKYEHGFLYDTGSGILYVLFGSDQFPASIDLATPPRELAFFTITAGANTQFFPGLGRLNDLNNDTYGDFYLTQSTSVSSRELLVVLGGDSHTTTTVTNLSLTAEQAFHVRSSNGTYSDNGILNITASQIGTFNSDLYSDFLVISDHKAYIICGKETMTDIDLDNFTTDDQIIVISHGYEPASFMIGGASVSLSNLYFHSSNFITGDADGDKLDDFLLLTSYVDTDATSKYFTFLFYGADSYSYHSTEDSVTNTLSSLTYTSFVGPDNDPWSFSVDFSFSCEVTMRRPIYIFSTSSEYTDSTKFTTYVATYPTECNGGYYVSGEDCLACPNGQMAGATGACEPCEAGFFTVSQGKICIPCPGTTNTVTGATSCTFCEVGHQIDVENNVCVVCPAGMQNLVAGGSCTACPTGYIKAAAEASECTKCANGMTNNEDFTECVVCPEGQYFNENDENSAPCSACLGVVVLDNDLPTSCTACPVNQFFDIDASTPACTACPANHVSSNGSECTLCVGPIDGDGACGVCPAGMGWDATLDTPACVACGSGMYSSATDTLCLACLGTASDSNGGSNNDTCTPCGAGQGWDVTLPTPGCAPCTGSLYSTADDHLCLECLGMPSDTDNHSSNDTCTPCVAGMGWDATLDSPNCVPCTGGMYASATDTLCMLCEGVASDSDSSGNNDTCTACTAGQYLMYSDSNVGSCPNCDANHTSLGGTSSCTSCPEGMYSAAGASSCTACPANMTTHGVGDNCNACPAGTYLPSNSVRCVSCPYGSFLNASNVCEQCPAGQGTNATLNGCEPCPIGFYSTEGSGCMYCPQGEHTSAAGQSACTSCGAGMASNYSRSACVGCYPGRFSGGDGDCDFCELGNSSEQSASTCTACTAGLFAGVPGDLCSTCLTGTFSEAGASRCTDCPPGMISVEDKTSCTLCAAGTFAASPGSDACANCNAGTFSNDARISCESCKTGYVAAEGASSCTACENGYVPNSASSSCDKCGNNEYAKAGADKECKKCGSGKKVNSDKTGCVNDSSSILLSTKFVMVIFAVFSLLNSIF